MIYHKQQISNLELKKYIKKYFGINLLKLTKSKTGFSDESYSAFLNNKSVFLRVSQSERGLAPEKYACELAQSVGVPTPKVLYYLQDNNIPYEILIMEQAQGLALRNIKLNNKQEVAVYYNMGSTLKKIHSIKLKGFGLLMAKKNDFVGEYYFWKEFILNKKRHYKKLLKHTIVTDQQLKDIVKTFSVLEELNPSPVFIHNDFHVTHIFIEKDKVSSVIDFSMASVGDARYDIAKSLYYLSNKRANYFKKGYGNLSQDPIIKKYILTIAVRKAIWTLENKIESRTHCIKKLQKIFKNDN